MDILNQVLDILKIFAPLAVLFFALITAYSVLKWTGNIKDSIKEITKSPASFIFGLIVIVLFFWIFFTYINPILQKI